MILSKYIFGRVLRVFVFAFIGVLVLVMLMDAIELLRKFGGRDDSLTTIFRLAALHAPSVAVKALPFVMLLSAMWAFITLARSSEMVAASAAGQSFWGQARAGMMAAAVIGVASVALYTPIAATALSAYERMESRLLGTGGSLLSVSAEGLWLRENTPEGTTVIRASQSVASADKLTDVSFFVFGPGDALLRRIDAETATLQDKAWNLSKASRHEVVYGIGAQSPEVFSHDEFEVPTRLTASEIQNSFAPPETMPIWRLPEVIRGMELAGFSARRHIAHFHQMLALPLFLAAMTLIAAAFAIRPPRSTPFGFLALGCALSGFSFYFLSDLSMAMGISGVAPAALAAWAPPIGAIFLGVGLAFLFGEA